MKARESHLVDLAGGGRELNAAPMVLLRLVADVGSLDVRDVDEARLRVVRGAAALAVADQRRDLGLVQPRLCGCDQQRGGQTASETLPTELRDRRRQTTTKGAPAAATGRS